MLLTSPLSSPLKNPVRDVFSPAASSQSLTAQVQAHFGARLQWFYDASDAATLGPTSAGPGVVTTLVGYAADKSTKARHLSQSNNAKRIGYAVDGGGRPYFYFDGTKTISLDTASINLSAETKLTVFFAGMLANTAATYKVPFMLNPTGSAVGVLVNGTGATVRVGSTDNNKIGCDTSLSIYEFGFSPAETRQLKVNSATVNGRQWGMQRYSVVDPRAATSFPVGILRFGDWGALNASWEGGIYSMLAVSGDISDSERALIVSMLAEKSGAPNPQPYTALNFSHSGAYKTTESHLGFDVNAYAALYFDTSATSVDVTYLCDGLLGFGYVSLGVYVNGAFYSQFDPPSAGTATTTVSLPAGAKRVGILSSAAAGNLAGTYPVMTRIKNLVFNAAATPYQQSASGRLLIYGDSVATGGHASPLLQNAWPLKLRQQTGADVVVAAESGRAFKTDYDHALTGGGYRDPLVRALVQYDPLVLWMAMGVNDYAQANWNATAFGAAYAETLDALHTALPSLVIYAQSPLNPAHGAAANAAGSTLQDYCNAIQTACTGRGWVTYVSGASIITSPGTQLTDGVHPNNAGNTAYADYVLNLLG